MKRNIVEYVSKCVTLHTILAEIKVKKIKFKRKTMKSELRLAESLSESPRSIWWIAEVHDSSPKHP